MLYYLMYHKDVSVKEVINQQLRLIITPILFIQLPFIDRFLIKNLVITIW